MGLWLNHIICIFALLVCAIWNQVWLILCIDNSRFVVNKKCGFSLMKISISFRSALSKNKQQQKYSRNVICDFQLLNLLLHFEADWFQSRYLASLFEHDSTQDVDACRLFVINAKLCKSSWCLPYILNYLFFSQCLRWWLKRSVSFRRTWKLKRCAEKVPKLWPPRYKPFRKMSRHYLTGLYTNLNLIRHADK